MARRRSTCVALVAVATLLGACGESATAPGPTAEKSSRSKTSASVATAADPNTVTVGDEQLRRMTIEAVQQRTFRTEKSAVGRIAFDEDATTPVFSPYTGRVVRLIGKPGDVVKRGSPLFEIDTPDLVQANSDLIAAQTGLVKAKNQLALAERVVARQEDLYSVKAVALKDVEQAQSDLRNAQSDTRAAEGAHAAARDRLRVFGKSDDEIARIETDRQIDRVTIVRSPIGGTITTRKVGPGQYVKPDNPDPLFTVADLSTMWLLASVPEADIPLVQVGQPVEVSVMAFPREVFRARIAYIGAAVDPTVRRLTVRAEVANPGGRLKPDMFASFRIETTPPVTSPAVPATAIIRDGARASVWLQTSPTQLVRRQIETGLEQDGVVQVLAGLRPGDRVVSGGALYLSNAEQGGS